MKLISKKTVTLLASALLAAGCGTFAFGADVFPSKPIRLICPFTPGGAVDISSRAIALELSKIWDNL